LQSYSQSELASTKFSRNDFSNFGNETSKAMGKQTDGHDLYLVHSYLALRADIFLNVFGLQ
jgi:hypothetical protein